MSRLNEYTFIITDLVTSNVVDIVELGSLHWDEIYNAPGSGLATARYDAKTTTRENFKDWKRALWAVQGGNIKWGGIIGQTQRRGETRVISVPIHGFWEYYRHRFIRGSTGMIYGQVLRQNELEWRNQEHFHIVKDIIDHCNTFENGDFGMTVVWDSVSGQNATKIHRLYTRPQAAQAVEFLAAKTTGFDFYHEYYWDGDTPRVRLKLRYPARSNVVNETLLFQPQVNTVDTITVLRALNVDGTTGNNASTTGESAITADLTVSAFISANDWTPTGIETIAQKWVEAGDQRSWRFQLLTTGALRFEWSTDGTAGGVLTEDSTNAVPFTDGSDGYVRVVMDVDNGASDYDITFEYSTDGTNWVDLAGPRTFGDEFGDEF